MEKLNFDYHYHNRPTRYILCFLEEQLPVYSANMFGRSSNKVYDRHSTFIVEKTLPFDGWPNSSIVLIFRSFF